MPGGYEVVVQAPGFEDLRLQWELRAGQRTELGNVVLARVGGSGLQGPPLPGADDSARGR